MTLNDLESEKGIANHSPETKKYFAGAQRLAHVSLTILVVFIDLLVYEFKLCVSQLAARHC